MKVSFFFKAKLVWNVYFLFTIKNIHIHTYLTENIEIVIWHDILKIYIRCISYIYWCISLKPASYISFLITKLLGLQAGILITMIVVSLQYVQFQMCFNAKWSCKWILVIWLLSIFFLVYICSYNKRKVAKCNVSVAQIGGLKFFPLLLSSSRYNKKD